MRAAHDAEHDRYIAAGVEPPGGWSRLNLPPFPDELRGMTCGARTRKGASCKQLGLFRNGRCKLHGGASVGAVTPEGRDRSRANLALRWPRKPMGVTQMTGSEALEGSGFGRSPDPYRAALLGGTAAAGVPTYMRRRQRFAAASEGQS